MSGFRHFSRKGGVIKFVAERRGGGYFMRMERNVTYEKKEEEILHYIIFLFDKEFIKHFKQ